MSELPESMPRRMKFFGKLWLIDGQLMPESSYWVHELDSLESGCRSGEEWAREHLQDTPVSDLYDRFNLPEGKDCHVLFTGYLSGWYDEASQEWDEDFEILESQYVLIPAEISRLFAEGP